MIYLYNYGKAPWKAQYWVRETMNRMYQPTPDGYCGDEDNGQTSAWYVFSALGFYPVTPATDEYVIGAPLFEKATIKLANGNTIEINAPNNSDDNRYIQSMRVNGSKYSKTFLRHSELVEGATLDFDMADKPNTGVRLKAADLPFSLSNE